MPNTSCQPKGGCAPLQRRAAHRSTSDAFCLGKMHIVRHRPNPLLALAIFRVLGTPRQACKNRAARRSKSRGPRNLASHASQKLLLVAEVPVKIRARAGQKRNCINCLCVFLAHGWHLVLSSLCMWEYIYLCNVNPTGHQMNKFLLLIATASFLLFGCAANPNAPASPQSPAGLSGINITSASTEELDACESVSPLNMKYWCFTNISIRTRNASYCEKIDSNYRELNQKNSCYLGVALLNSDPELCGKLPNNGFCYTNVSVAGKDVAICDKIADSQSKGDCYSQVAAATGDISICDKIYVEASGTSYSFVTHQQSQYGPAEITEEYKETCYAKVADASGDESICEKIQNPTAKDSCYEFMDYTKLSTSLCDKIQNIDVRGNCYTRLAGYKQDPSICDKISKQESKDYCHYAFVSETIILLRNNSSYLSRAARLNTNSSVCDDMKTISPKDRCYWLTATINGNYSLCQKILTPYYKTECENLESAANSIPSQCPQSGSPPLPCP